MKYVALLFWMMFCKGLFAQINKPLVNGEYYLRGVMEAGSGFSFKADHTFEFFFAYGALDREGKGTWEQHGDSIILNSTKKPPQDYKLVQQKNTGSKQITIAVKNNNPMILRNIYAEIKCADTTYRDQSDEHGQFIFNKCKVEKITLVHEFFHEPYSVFDVKDAAVDYYEFTIEPWISEVEFQKVILVFKDGELSGPHPLLKEKNYIYIKGGK